MSVNDVIAVLASAERQGASVDQPEGARYIQASETLAHRMIEALEAEWPSL